MVAVAGSSKGVGGEDPVEEWGSSLEYDPKERLGGSIN